MKLKIDALQNFVLVRRRPEHLYDALGFDDDFAVARLGHVKSPWKSVSG